MAAMEINTKELFSLAETLNVDGDTELLTLEAIAHDVAHVVCCTGQASVWRGIGAVSKLIEDTCPTIAKQDSNEILATACTAVLMEYVTQDGDTWLDYCLDAMLSNLQDVNRDTAARRMKRAMSQKATVARAMQVAVFLQERSVLTPRWMQRAAVEGVE